MFFSVVTISAAPLLSLLLLEALTAWKIQCRLLVALPMPQSVKEELSIMAELALLVRDEGAQRDLYRMGPDDLSEAGPFKVSQGSVRAVYNNSQKQGWPRISQS